MLFAGCAFFLFLQVCPLSGFLQVSLQATTPQITLFSPYKVTILSSFDSAARFIQKDDNIRTTFPAEVPLQDTVTPETCYRIDAGGVPRSLACTVLPGNIVSFNLDMTVDTVVAPLTFVLGPARNPDCVMVTSSFQVAQYRSGVMQDSRTAGLTAQYSPGSITNYSLTVSNLAVYTPAMYTLVFTPQHAVPQYGKLLVVFPTPDFALGGVSVLTASAKVGEGVSVQLTVSVPAANQVMASGLFAQQALSPLSNITLLITPITSPDSMRTSQSLALYTTTQAGQYIDMCSTGLTVTPNQPRLITNLGITATPATVALPALYSFNMSPDISFPQGGKLTLTLPSALSQSSSLSCSFALGFSLSSSAACTMAGGLLSTTGVAFTKGADNLYLVFTVSGLSNPMDTVSTTGFQAATYDANGYLMCQILNGPGVQATPGVLTVATASRRSPKVAAAGPYTLSFVLTTAIPQFALIKLFLPAEQLTAQSLSCHVVSGATTLPGDICADGLTATGAGVYAIMKEWCSSGVAGCAAGTKLSLSLQGVSNLPYVQTGSLASVEVYTMNQMGTGVVDQVTGGVLFAPNLQAETLTSASCSRVGDTVGRSTVYTFSLASPVPLVQNAILLLTFPQGVLFPDSSGVPVQSHLNDSPTSHSTLTAYTDTSLKTLTPDQLCASGCPAGNVISVKISGGVNVAYVGTGSGTYEAEWRTAQGYLIAGRTVDSSLIGAFVSDTIVNISITRSSNSVQTPVQVSVSFLHPTELSVSSVISLSFPDYLLLPAASMSCARAQDSTSLGFTSTVYGSGAVSSVLVSSYCTTQCPKNTLIKLVFAGLTTPQAARPITGAISVTTSHTSYIVNQGTMSDVSSQLAALVPGVIVGISIDPANPTVSVETGYRVIGTSTHGIPAGAQVTIAFPSDIVVGSGNCSGYLLLDAGLQCTVTGNGVVVKQGFLTGFSGSWMIGVLISSVRNSITAGQFGPISISIQTPEGYTIDTGTGTVRLYASYTQPCDSACQACTGTSSTCSSCVFPSALPFQRSNSCLFVCSAGTFLVSTPLPLACVACHYTCRECSSGLATECINCAGGLVKSDRECMQQCPSGTIESSGVCVNTAPCTSPCLACSSSPTFCLSCLASSSYPVFDSVNGKCVSARTSTTDYCPAFYFQSGLSCAPCDPLCASCTEIASQCTSCRSLYGRPLLNLLDNSCVAVCPSGVTVLVGTTCALCHQSCRTCSGTGANTCVACPETGTKYKTSDGQCVSTCPAGTYAFNRTDGSFICVSVCDTNNRFFIDVAAGYCRNCHSSCLTCSGPGNLQCSTCDQTGILVYWTEDGQCSSSCPASQFTYTLNNAKLCYFSCPTPSFNFLTAASQAVCTLTCPSTGYFINSTTNYCSPCDSSCLTCVGPTPANCLTCDQAYLTDTGLCVATCPGNMFTYGVNGEKKCYTNCPNGTYNYERSEGKVCSLTCGVGHWVEVATNYCRACFTQCLSCSSGTNQSCVACPATYPYLTDDFQCLSSCPTGSFLSALGPALRCLSVCPQSSYYFTNADTTVSCVATCNTASGYFIDSVTKFCAPCSHDCRTCAATGTCLSCDSASSLPFLTADAHCQSSCPSTQFSYTLNNAQLCFFSCPSPSFNSVSSAGVRSCIPSCPSLNYYIDLLTNYCSSCEASCLACSGPTSSNCSSCDVTGATPLITADNRCVGTCPTSMFLYAVTNGVPSCMLVCPAGTFYSLVASGSNKCIDSCGAGNYLDPSRYCYPCQGNCLTCAGLTASSCLSCDPAGSVPYLTETGNCVAACGSLYRYQLGGVKKCYSSCPNTYQYQDPSTGVLECISTCGAGYYLDTNTNTCWNCYSSCQTCSGTTVSACLSCLPAFPYLTDAHQCVAACPAGYFLSTLGGEKRCYGTCPSGSFNYESVSTGERECISVCGTGFFVEGTYCRQCFSTCQTCSASGSCLTCSKSSLFPYLTDTQQCVSTCTSPSQFTLTASMRCYSQCPSGFFKYADMLGYWCIAACPAGNYVDAAASYCRQCASTCLSCNGTEASHCLSCDPTGSTPYLTDTGYCVPACSATVYTYQLGGAKRCVSVCPFGSYGYRDSGKQVCVSTCGDGFYLSSDSQTCYPCDSTCVTCKGTSSTDCMACNKSSLVPYLSDSGQCLSSCPALLFIYNPAGEQRCVTACPQGSFNSEFPTKTCVFSCGAGFYVDGSYCRQCTPTCRSCAMGGCLSCERAGSTPWFTDGQQCVAGCPATMFSYSPNGEMKCVSTCPQGYYGSDSPAKTCISSCGAGFYVETAANYCRQCFTTCQTCKDGTSQGCLTCQASLPLLSEAGDCVATCPASLFTYTSLKICVSLCPAPLFSSYLPVGKTCAVTCSSTNYYLEKDSNICKPCAASCLTCSGGSANQCLSCDTAGLMPNLSSEGTCVSRCSSDQYAYNSQGELQCLRVCPTGTLSYDIGSKQCVPTCPAGSYANSGACVKCDVSCAQCSGGTAQKCLICAANYVSSQSSCLSSCPQGYRASNGVCVVACSQSSCLSCQSSAVCTNCLPGYLLYQSTCFPSCPDSTYRSGESCTSCDSSCFLCSGNRNDQCTSCRTGSALYLGKCLGSCPDGLEARGGKCQVPVPCELPCSQCIEGTADLCTSCPTGRYLHRNNCLEACPSHTFVSGAECGECAADCESCSGAASLCIACGNSTYLTTNHTCDLTCSSEFTPNNSTRLCDLIPLPEPNTTTPAIPTEPSLQHSSYYPLAVHIGLLVGTGVLCLASKLYRPDMHLTQANALAMLSAVDMCCRLSLLVVLWRFQAAARAYEIGVSAGLLVGSVSLSMMFLVLYLDPVMETSASLDLFVSSHRLSYQVFRLAAHVCGLHFVRLLYGGLFGLELFSNLKTLGTNVGFRQPLEKLSLVQCVGMLGTQILQSVSVLLLYPPSSDPFHLAAFGLPINLAIAALFLLDYFRGPWR